MLHQTVSHAALLLLSLPLALGTPTLNERQVLSPTVTISHPQATIVGSDAGTVQSFKGIPFAKPPVGNLRLRPPQALTKNQGVVNATGMPQSCPQQSSTSVNTSALPTEVLNNPLLAAVSGPAAEDCLTLNVQRPSTATAGSKLPVVFWIYGGGFEAGSTGTYDATELITNSITQNKDIVYVEPNYRLSAFGFLGGKEILEDGASNIGLLDQRLALQWVADNIAQFGGDPSKVTIWGESAGAISVFDQMALYNGNNKYKGKPLFRGAIMDSGSIVPADPVDGIKGQQVFDQVASAAGCGNAANKLTCLRKVNYTTFDAASNSLPGIFSYSSVALAYLPRPDGKVLTASPDVLIQHGKFAKVPFIIGDQEDEGTLFSLVQSNISTSNELVTYLSTVFFPFNPRAQIAKLVAQYPDNPSAGSPFRTGVANNIYPEYKRLAAILGDITFTLVRRIFLSVAHKVNPEVPSWSYLASYDYGTPTLGTFHGSDILQIYGTTPGFVSESIQAYYLSFFNTLNPNDGTVGLTEWPQWGVNNTLLNFNVASNDLLPDTFRPNAYNFLVSQNGTIKI